MEQILRWPLGVLEEPIGKDPLSLSLNGGAQKETKKKMNLQGITIISLLLLFVSVYQISCGSIVNAYLSRALGEQTSPALKNSILRDVSPLLIGFITAYSLQYLISFIFDVPFFVHMALDLLEVFILVERPAWVNSLTLEALRGQQAKQFIPATG